MRLRSAVACAARVGTWMALTAALAASQGCSDAAPTRPGPLEALTGRTWVLESLGAGSTLPGTALDLALHAGGSFNGSSGCNLYSGNYRLAGSTLTLRVGAVTLRACAPEVDAQEADYLARLASVDGYTLTSSKRLDLRAAGVVVLRFRER